jgi:hypothetical protein
MGMLVLLRMYWGSKCFNLSNFRRNELLKEGYQPLPALELRCGYCHSPLCVIRCRARLKLTSHRAQSSYASRYAISLFGAAPTSADFKEQISSTLIKSFDKVVEVLAEVGQSLPQFQKYTELFKQNQHIKQVLCLFFRDILDFHATVLNFFRKNSRHAIY